MIQSNLETCMEQSSIWVSIFQCHSGISKDKRFNPVTQQSDISRARNWLIKGQRKIMLYTERAHFYHRYKISGIQNLIIYSLPERKEFYPEVLNMLEGSPNMTCTVLFSRFDQLRGIVERLLS